MNKEMTHERTCGLVRDYYGILSCGGHVESNDTMSCTGSLPF